MRGKRTTANGASRQTALNIIDMADFMDVKISDIEDACGMARGRLARIAKDVAGHRLYVQDALTAAGMLGATLDDLAHWHESSHGAEYQVQAFLMKCAAMTERGQLEWRQTHDKSWAAVYEADILDDAVLCASEAGGAWLKTGNSTHPVAKPGTAGVLAILSAISRGPVISKQAWDAIDAFMARTRPADGAKKEQEAEHA